MKNQKDKFNTLASRWKLETGAYSTTIHKIANSNYREIINMGFSVVPFILKDLENSPVWFPALRELTKENPVKREDAGNTEKMREAWINWGKEKGIE